MTATTDARLGAAMDVRFGATAEAFLDYLTDLGLDHVEFKREYLHGHPDAPTPEDVRELADRYGVSVTYHAPFRDWNLGSFNEESRRASVRQVKRTIDDAATAGAGAVVVHGGSVPRRYPEWVRSTARENARHSLAECAEYAHLVGVPLCLENQPRDESECRYTTTPSDLEAVLAEVDVTPEYFGVTLDVGHATVNDCDWGAFVERFGDRIRVCHLHDNDGTADLHEPLTDYEPVVEAVPADYFVFETKSVADVARCVGAEPTPIDSRLTSDT
ncbi:sugar phosphate isomerase/epimerase family protein [Haloarcula pellucida]|uniref:Xylose isomerase n=1 Tax=Haloarcula pellucida TaxID=1427151 RepID=A0A830GP34_9EURY|nr:sugar phosphate isomerase/epimerase family protein [Halomicroarcula pellucida]GGN97515.1 xylose isomerase [Halomicroarcula pellucida]